MNWDDYFMLLAAACAAKSKDPSTKVGAVIVGPDKNVLTTGFNGFPRGVKDTEDRLNDRKTKLALVAHAERNAMDQAARHGISLRGSTLYVTPMPPCAECAKSIIQSGIVRVVCPPIEPGHAWYESAMLARQMFEEAGVVVDEIRQEDVRGVPVRAIENPEQNRLVNHKKLIDPVVWPAVSDALRTAIRQGRLSASFPGQEGDVFTLDVVAARKQFGGSEKFLVHAIGSFFEHIDGVQFGGPLDPSRYKPEETFHRYARFFMAWRDLTEGVVSHRYLPGLDLAERPYIAHEKDWRDAILDVANKGGKEIWGWPSIKKGGVHKILGTFPGMRFQWNDKQSESRKRFWILD